MGGWIRGVWTASLGLVFFASMSSGRLWPCSPLSANELPNSSGNSRRLSFLFGGLNENPIADAIGEQIDRLIPDFLKPKKSKSESEDSNMESDDDDDDPEQAVEFVTPEGAGGHVVVVENPATVSECDDVEPLGATCKQLEQHGACSFEVVISNNVCRNTCGHCKTATADAVPEAENPGEIEEKKTGGCMSVMDVLSSRKDLRILKKLVEVSEDPLLTTVLGPKFQGTFFAPNLKAFQTLFDKLGVTEDEFFEANPLSRDEIVEAHIVPGLARTASDLRDGQEFPTLTARWDVFIKGKGETLKVVSQSDLEASLVARDLVSCDSVIHVVNKVLLPAPFEVVEKALNAGTPIQASLG